jgi:hypothetical protein
MRRSVFAMAVAASVFAAVSGTSQAAPIAPLSAGVTAADSGQVTQVRWYRGRHWGRPWRGRCWWRHGYRHCW